MRGLGGSFEDELKISPYDDNIFGAVTQTTTHVLTTQLTHDEQCGRYVQLHPLDTFFEVSDEPVARSDDGVDLRHGEVVQLLPSVVKI